MCSIDWDMFKRSAHPTPLFVRPWTRVRAWEETAVGPELAEQLGAVEVGSLSDAECLAYAQAVARQQAWTDSLLVAATARFAAARPDGDPQVHPPEVAPPPGAETTVALGGHGAPLAASFTPAQWGAAMGVSTCAARRRMADALDLVHRLPGVWMSLNYGWCDLARARMVATCTRELSEATTCLVQQEVVPILATLTLAQLRQIIEELAATTEPEVLETRAAVVRTRREVWIDATNDDHAEVSATLDTVDARRLEERLNELARLLGSAQRAGVGGCGPPGESWQQRRARALGLLADPASIATLLHGTGEEGGGASDGPGSAWSGTGLRPTTVYLHVRADGTCDVEGHGTVSIPTVRELIESSALTVRPVIDLNTDYRSSGYRPAGTVAESVLLTNPRCVFPYCDRTARDCQLDHTVPYPHGPTTTSNLGPLCVHHHQIKTDGKWALHQLGGGTYAWRAPTGHAYTVTPNGTTRL
jgi:hypothetical protein